MRIAFVISGLGFGGAERQVVLLSRELVRLGHGVLVYTLNREVPRAAELEGSGVKLVVDQKASRLDPRVLRRLRAALRSWKPDVVQGMLFDGDLYARLAAAGLGVPVFSSSRNDNYEVSPMHRLAYRVTRGLTCGLVANSFAGARFMQRVQGFRDASTHVVWNGIDLAEVDRRLARSTAPAHSVWPGAGLRRVAVVGSIKPQKDHALALRVAAELHRRDPAWRFLFVGDSFDAASAYKQSVLALREALHAEPYTAFVGVRSDVPELMASSDALLVTSHYEGFPNVVLEAMAAGCPVVSTDYSDVRRIVPLPWQVCDSREPSALADRVEQATAQRDEVRRLQRQWVEDHATVNRAARALLGVYAGQAAPGGRLEGGLVR